MLRLYLDEDSMDQALVRALRARGVDVMTAHEAGMIERSDRDHLQFTTAEGRVLCTFNVGDFYELHSAYPAQSKTHAGIILAPQQRYSVGEQMRRLLRLIATMPAGAKENHVEVPQRMGAGALVSMP